MTIGLDTNILCYALDPAYLEHPACKKLLLKLSSTFHLSLNPTILHETYHTLVFGQKWVPDEAKKRLSLILQHPYIEFYNQTKRTCTVALSMAVKLKLGGRDSLILANLITNKTPTLYTHDEELLRLKEVKWEDSTLTLEDPTTRH